MLRNLLIAISLVASLTGCQWMPARHKSASDFDSALLDKQLIDAARSIQQTQAELRSISVVSTPATVATAAQAQHPAPTSSKPITLDWHGDATDLARLLALGQGLGFDTRGVKIPLPVSLTTKQEPYDKVLGELVAQIDYRATIYKLPGRMVLEYTPTTGVQH